MRIWEFNRYRAKNILRKSEIANQQAVKETNIRRGYQSPVKPEKLPEVTNKILRIGQPATNREFRKTTCRIAKDLAKLLFRYQT